MKKLSALLVAVAITSTFLISCSPTSSLISNGAYSDVSLNQNSDKFEIKRLQEVKSEGRAVFGIPHDSKVGNKTGMIVRFNGVNLTGTKRILPVLTLIGLSVAGGIVMRDLIGFKEDPSNPFREEYKVNLGISSILALPVSGLANNQIWSDAGVGRAAQKLNRQLVENNPEVDVFLNPKYIIEKQNGLWGQKCSISVKTMGATLKVN